MRGYRARFAKRAADLIRNLLATAVFRAGMRGVYPEECTGVQAFVAPPLKTPAGSCQGLPGDVCCRGRAVFLRRGREARGFPQ